jgi:hypothetical protein
MFNNFSENRAVYEIMWKKYGAARQATDDNIIRRMAVSCWITKPTDTHSEYVILIAFPRQPWLCERAHNVTFVSTLPVLYTLVSQPEGNDFRVINPEVF